MSDWNQLIFSDEPFPKKARKIFRYQLENNPVYRRFCAALDYPVDQPESAREQDFPLLPVRTFKDTGMICPPGREPEIVFHSSGTSGMTPARHLVVEADIYRRSVLKGFRHFYEQEDLTILGYTPLYSENEHSSLISMINELISGDPSGMSRFLPLGEPLRQQEIDTVEKSGRQLIIFGAAFGLLDLLEISKVSLPSSSIVMETGGMKTHRRNMTRSLLHHKLAEGFGVPINRVHSEYGMTELLSQAYALGGRWFRTAPWMQVTIRDPDDPRRTLPPRVEGRIGVIDLANVHSCPFLLTGDRGVMDERGLFRVLGRWHPGDLRGCNFLIEED